MTTRADIVTLALNHLQIADLVDAPKAEHAEIGLTALNGLLEEGRSIGKAFIWWTSANDDNIPTKAINSLSLALAGVLAKDFTTEGRKAQFEMAGEAAKGDLLLLSDTSLTLRRDIPRG